MSARLKKPYACSICFKKFSVSLHLVNHVEFKHLSPNQPLKPKDSDEEQCLNTDEKKVKIEIIDANSVDEQVDMEADNDPGDKYLSQNEADHNKVII